MVTSVCRLLGVNGSIVLADSTVGDDNVACEARLMERNVRYFCQQGND